MFYSFAALSFAIVEDRNYDDIDSSKNEEGSTPHKMWMVDSDEDDILSPVWPTPDDGQ